MFEPYKALDELQHTQTETIRNVHSSQTSQRKGGRKTNTFLQRDGRLTQTVSTLSISLHVKVAENKETTISSTKKKQHGA